MLRFCKNVNSPFAFLLFHILKPNCKFTFLHLVFNNANLQNCVLRFIILFCKLQILRLVFYCFCVFAITFALKFFNYFNEYNSKIFKNFTKIGEITWTMTCFQKVRRGKIELIENWNSILKNKFQLRL